MVVGEVDPVGSLGRYSPPNYSPTMSPTATLKLDKRVCIITGAGACVSPCSHFPSTSRSLTAPYRPLSPLLPPSSCPCSGIGLESALVFAKEGAHVVVADINEEAAQRAVELIKSEIEGANEAIAIKCDVSKEGDIEALVAKTVEKFGRLDVMLYALHSPFSSLTRRAKWG